jgi:hypothetical protein
MAKSLRRRCDAWLPFRQVAQDRAIRAGELGKFLGRNRHCRKWAVVGSKRCRLHGGLSTGPTTPEGMARTVAAMQAGRLRWLARLKAEGKPIPCGRKKGGRNLPADEREQIAYEKEAVGAEEIVFLADDDVRIVLRAQPGQNLGSFCQNTETGCILIF